MGADCVAYRLRGFVVGARDLPAGEPAASAHPALVHPLVGADHLVAAGLHTLALDAHRRGVGAAGRPVDHLQGHVMQTRVKLRDYVSSLMQI